MTLALLDVCYRPDGARAACVLADGWTAATPCATHAIDLESVEEYQPGNFYRRELPCLLALLDRLPARPDLLVIDGYVWLASASRPGLGAHLYQALGASVPVIGIAKTAFLGATESPVVAPVLRGVSRRPLFVSAADVGLDTAAAWVQAMAGPHRIPELVAAVDRLSRRQDT